MNDYDSDHSLFDTVVCEIEAGKYDAFKRSSAALQSSETSRISGPLGVGLSREKILCTGFGHGVAVAHGRTDGVRGSSSVGIVRRDPICSPDGKPVHLPFRHCSPPSGHTTTAGSFGLVRRAAPIALPVQTLMEADDASEVSAGSARPSISAWRVCAPVPTGPTCTSVTWI